MSVTVPFLWTVVLFLVVSGLIDAAGL